jgi:hypothetical protein
MKSREERIEYIRRVHKAALDDNISKNYYTIKHWRGKPLYRKVIQIDSEYLMFRIENSRTEIQQLSYIRSKSLPSDFFNDPESYLVQQAQEEILINMVRNKGKDLLDDLRLRKQEDPCIITYDGYLVNGNRRTSALKSLDERYIECVVLPEDTTPKDIYFLEQQLQISEDFREEYHWINELRNIRKGLEDTRLNFTEKELANNLRLDLKDLRVKLKMLDLVDAFLIWKNIKGQYDYSKLDDAEEVFRQLEKAIKKYNRDIVKQKSLQNAIFILIEERPTSGRLYNYVTALIKNFDKVCDKMPDDSEEKIKSETELVANDSDKDILEELIGDKKNDNIDIFNDPANAQETASILIDAIADVQAENKEKRNAEAVYEGVSAALRDIQGLIIDSETAKINSIRNKLEQIIDAALRLLREANSIGK